MQRPLLALALVLALAGAASAQPAGTAADHEALRKLKAEATEALNKRDYVAAERLLAKPFAATTITQDSFTDFAKLKTWFEGLYSRDFLRLKSMTLAAEADELSAIHTGTFALTRGSTRERYEMADGRVFDLNGRWTAVSIKDGNDWKLLGIHTGVNFLDNPVVAAIEKSLMWFGLGGGVIGLILGFAGGWFMRRPRRA